MSTPLPALVRAALNRADARPALCFADRWYAWGELRALAAGVDAALTAAGAPAAAPVGFVPRNRPEAVAALLALLAAGRSVRMIYAFQSADQIAASLRRPGIAAVVLHAQDVAPEILASARAEGLGLVVLAEDGSASAELAAGPAGQAVAAEAAPRIEILTSGTTGPPKHFPVPYSLIEQHFLSTPLTQAQGDAPEAAAPFLLYFPLGNITGLYSTLPTLLHGQRAILLERFSVEAWHAYVRAWRPVHAGVPPSAVRQILEADLPVADLASIARMGVGAAPLDPAVQAAFEARYGIPVLLSYGATEFAGPVAMMTAELHAQWGASKRGSVGRALPGVQLRVVDDTTGRRCPPGETGLLQVIAPRIGPEWIATADLACLDADGFLFLKGRADGAIMRGGFKILPETIEAALLLHPAVAEAAVTGVADSRVGEVPAAAVRLVPGAEVPATDALAAHVRRHCLATHVPVHWWVGPELPRTPSLKVDRQALKRLFSDALPQGEG
ncbi:class I adenylate-forming enzyme family protein [Novosphingobium piscinae]|uniref:Long-chain fatty acid--CoA ligase n=1 Tax=Novosphingobium piscinae TaxID=1507448 RepID=A0A7X1FWM7_9SPHN|nr:fatty acid--CoA ligase family protein [Novosphingobium piscinae]MBC2667712.1 long-chain fatty acid--CoA ligase [Novosphingobium piscinae]